MRILVTGQCTLHWGRLEFGNIGNYYIIEPFFRELHKAFPDSEIRTTFQMTDEFCQREKVTRIPMDLYYAWNESDITNAKLEVDIAKMYHSTGILPNVTPYIKEVLNSDLIVDYSGDMWGDNSDFLGPNRFEVGLYKNFTAQLLGKPVALIAGSPGPFGDSRTRQFAEQVFSKFDLVTNREKVSTLLLNQADFRTDHVVDLACPSFLFESLTGTEKNQFLDKSGLAHRKRPIIGFIICGWNFVEGPFDKWPRRDDDYILFAEAVEYIETHLGADVCLLSHANGFIPPPDSFRLIHGRDYAVIRQLQKILSDRGIAKKFFVLDEIYSTWETPAIISSFDMLVSGRVHGAVAALSQSIPTVIIDYGHKPKAHKLRGFAEVAGVGDLLSDIAEHSDLIEKIEFCWKNRNKIHEKLKRHIPYVKKQAILNFTLLQNLVHR